MHFSHPRAYWRTFSSKTTDNFECANLQKHPISSLMFKKNLLSDIYDTFLQIQSKWSTIITKGPKSKVRCNIGDDTYYKLNSMYHLVGKSLSEVELFISIIKFMFHFKRISVWISNNSICMNSKSLNTTKRIDLIIMLWRKDNIK